MKTKKPHGILSITLVFILLLFLVLMPLLLIGGFGFFLFWTSTAPSHVNVVFPRGTQIIEQTDTHRGFFRSEGIAIVVAQIPRESVQTFGDALVAEGFWTAPPHAEAQEKLGFIPAATLALKSDNILWTYRDEAFALIEEPFSDCFTAIFDLDTGLLCCVEYDS